MSRSRAARLLLLMLLLGAILPGVGTSPASARSRMAPALQLSRPAGPVAGRFGVTAYQDLAARPALSYLRLVGGSKAEQGARVAVGGSGNVFLAGTFLATRANDVGNAVAVDRWGNVYVAGSTGASRIPSTQGTVMSGKHYCGEEGDIFPCQSAFVVELSPWLDHLVYSRMLRGNGLDRADALAVDASGAAVVGGYTESSDFPTVQPIQPATGGGECSEGRGGSAPCDGFVAAIAPHGLAVTFSTYVGGNGQDEVESVAPDGHGGVILAGTTLSGNLASATGAPLVAQRIFLGRIDHVLR